MARIQANNIQISAAKLVHEPCRHWAGLDPEPGISTGVTKNQGRNLVRG